MMLRLKGLIFYLKGGVVLLVVHRGMSWTPELSTRRYRYLTVGRYSCGNNLRLIGNLYFPLPYYKHFVRGQFG